ncbi:hypothetical protein JOM56_012566 [Amanita muscaria]
MNRYSSYYMSHKAGHYDDSHTNHDMHGASHEFRLPLEPGVANSSFAGISSHPQTTANYGKNRFYDQNINPELEEIHNDSRGLSILRNATHDMLIESRNQEYARIYAERQDLMERTRKLEIRIEILEEQQDKREKSFIETITNMSSKGSTASIGRKSFAERRNEALRTVFSLAYKSEDELSDIVEGIQDYPGVNFWRSKSFKTNVKYPGEVGKRLRFLEDMNGEPMKQKRLDEIHRFLNGAFRELKELMYDLLSKKGWATEVADTIKLEDSGESDSGETVTSVPAKRVAEPSKTSRKRIKKEFKIPELPDPLATKPPMGTTGISTKEPATSFAPLPAASTINLNALPASAASITPSTTISAEASDQLVPQATGPTVTNTVTLQPSSSSSTATGTDSATLDTDDFLTPKTIEMKMTSVLPDPSIVPPDTSNVSTASSSSTFVTRNKDPQPPQSLKLSLKLPPKRLPTESSSTAPNAVASHGPRPRPLSVPVAHGIDKTNLATAAAMPSAQEPSDKSESGKGKSKATRGRKPAKEYVLDADSATPKDLFAKEYFADPDNEGKLKADVLKAWNALGKDEKREYFELSKLLKRERNMEKEN